MKIHLIGLLVLAAGCSKAGADSGPTKDVLAAWQKAGLEPSTFEPVAQSPYGEARCRAGKVKGVDATLCELADVADAKRAEATAMSSIKDATGLALAEGKLLLVLVNRGGDDPSGKRINEIARTFRNR